MRVRALDQPRGWAYTVAASIVKPTMLATTRQRWIGGENIPATGGCVVALNHLSYVDPFTAAHLLHDHGRIPRYLAKASLFRNPVLAQLLRSAGQIPVQRMTLEAASAFDAAVTAVRAGECVVVYPEGTITRDPDLWPMVGKTGAARIALATGCPVVPVGQWGPQDLLAPYAHKPDLFPRKLITMKVGPPVPLQELDGGAASAAEIARATEQIMDAITALVADLRDEPAPADRFDPRRHGVAPLGRPDGTS